MMNLEIAQTFVLDCFHEYKNWWWKLYDDAPLHLFVETGLLLFIVWLVFIRKTIDPTKSKTKKLTEEEVKWLVDTWEPEPLAPVLDARSKRIGASMKIVDAVNGNVMSIRGIEAPVLNLSSYDFIGSSLFHGAKEAAKEALYKYGCGSCGPRGFYGTIDVHLELEAAVAKFLGTEVRSCLFCSENLEIEIDYFRLLIIIIFVTFDCLWCSLDYWLNMSLSTGSYLLLGWFFHCIFCDPSLCKARRSAHCG
jgi:hypothetical protein